MGANALLELYRQLPESSEPEWDHPDYAATLAERPTQQEGAGRAPTPQERASANGLPAWWYQGGEDMRARAQRGGSTADVVRALSLALAGTRGGNVNGAVAGGMPAPMRVPLPSRYDPQPLLIGGEGPMIGTTAAALVGNRKEKYPEPYDGMITPRESVGGHLTQLPDYMRAPPGQEGTPQFLGLKPISRPWDLLAPFSGYVGGHLGGAGGEWASKAEAMRQVMARLKDTRGISLAGARKVEPLREVPGR